MVARIDATEPGTIAADTVPSGFPSLDRVLGGGLRRQDLAILAGDVGSGKSALALGIAIRAARAGFPTLFLSGEMSPERVMERALALEGKAAVDDLRQGRLDPTTRASVGAAAHRLRDMPLLLRPMLARASPPCAEAWISCRRVRWWWWTHSSSRPHRDLRPASKSGSRCRCGR